MRHFSYTNSIWDKWLCRFEFLHVINDCTNFVCDKQNTIMDVSFIIFQMYTWKMTLFFFFCDVWLICMWNVMSHMWHVTYVWHDSYICVTWLIHMCEMTHSYVWHDWFIRVTWLTHVCDMTHLYGCHDWFIRVTWLIHKCGMTDSCVCHDSFICVTWLISFVPRFTCSQCTSQSHMCDMTHSYVLHHAFIRVSWMIHKFGMTDSCVCHNSHVLNVDGEVICVTWLTHMCYITYVYWCRDWFISLTWLIYVCSLNDWGICVTWQIHRCCMIRMLTRYMMKSYVWCHSLHRM